jgi:hypothetical protein
VAARSPPASRDEVAPGAADMSDTNSDAPNVKIIPPLVYLAGVVIGFRANIWMPIKVVPNLVAWWAIGGILILCGAVSVRLCLIEIQGCGHDSST